MPYNLLLCRTISGR